MESTDVINEIRGILPRNSIGKYDLLTIFTHKTVFDKIVKVLSLDFQNKVDYVAAPEAIGWILGTAIAKELGVGFIGVRKGDKLPYAKEEIISTHFTDYSGQDKSFEISKSSIVRNKRVLIVDDWIETGSQMKALIALLESIFFTGITICTKKSNTNNPLGLISIANLFTGFFIFIFLSPSIIQVMEINNQYWLYIIILGVVQMGLGYSFYTIGVQHTSPQKASIISIWELILGPLWVAIFLKEFPNTLVLMGFILILIGMILEGLLVSTSKLRDKNKLINFRVEEK